jgi:YVTN family beta-propeller protein
MKRYVANLSFFGILLAMPMAASDLRIWVPNQNAATISIIDPATNKVVQTITGVAKPYSMVFAPDGSRAYVVDVSSKHILSVVDTKTGKIIKEVHLSARPSQAVISKDGKRIFVTLKEAPPVGGVDIVDTTSLEKVKTLPMIGSMHDIHLTPDGKYAIAGASNTPFLQPTYPLVVIDVQTEQPAWEVRSAKGVLTFAIESGPDGSTSRIFVEHAGLHGFSVVDFVKRKEMGTIKFPDDPKFTFEGNSNEDNPTHGTEIAPDGKTLWVCARASNNIYVYSLPELKLEGQLYMPELEVAGEPVQGGDPHWITFTPDGKTAYVPMSYMKMVVAIDVKTMKVVARIPTGENPRWAKAFELP